MANPRGSAAELDFASGRRLIVAEEIRFSEIISALSVALDITQGHPQGHCMRTALIGMRMAELLRLSLAEDRRFFMPVAERPWLLQQRGQNGLSLWR